MKSGIKMTGLDVSSIQSSLNTLHSQTSELLGTPRLPRWEAIEGTSMNFLGLKWFKKLN